MPESSTKPDHFDRLLSEMPRISEAVNTFTDVKCQRAALDALVRAFGALDAPAATSAPAQPALSVVPAVVVEQVPDVAEDEAVEAEAPTTKTPGRRKRNGKRSWEPDRNIEFWPKGVESFTDFVADKDPKSNDQKNVVAVYWLEQVAGIKEIGLPQLDAAYKVCDWRESADLNASLRGTAYRTHWLETSNMKAIATTPTGRNAVKHEMPINKDKKPA